jgi:two-component sensor histidine kinase
LNTGNKTEALKNFHRTIEIFIDLSDSLGIAISYNNLAKIYRQQEDFHRTQKSLDKAIAIASELNNTPLLGSLINAKAGLKRELGDIDESLILYQEALSLAKANGNGSDIARTLNNIGVIYLEKKDYEKAKGFYERAHKIVKEENYLEGQAFTLISLGRYYIVTNNPEQAINLSSEALIIGEKLKNEEIKLKAIKLLLEVFESQKDWERAFFYQKLLIKQNNKSEKNTMEQITQQESIRFSLEKDRFITQKREVEQALEKEKKAQRENIFYIVSSIVFFVLIAALFIIYYRLRASRERNKSITKLSEERKLLLQEVHHRVKNNFQIVSSMLRLQSYNFDNEVLRLNFEEAVNRINAMAIVHDVIYRQEKFTDINSKLYLEKLIQSLHKTGDSRITIAVESEEAPFKIETLINLGIAINELITNSFKHAFNHNIDNPKISISLCSIGNKMYELNYKDNGIGISKGNYSTNFGMDLIETIIHNYEGEVQLVDDEYWNTSIRVTFREF